MRHWSVVISVLLRLLLGLLMFVYNVNNDRYCCLFGVYDCRKQSTENRLTRCSYMDCIVDNQCFYVTVTYLHSFFRKELEKWVNNIESTQYYIYEMYDMSSIWHSYELLCNRFDGGVVEIEIVCFMGVLVVQYVIHNGSANCCRVFSVGLLVCG